MDATTTSARLSEHFADSHLFLGVPSIWMDRLLAEHGAQMACLLPYRSAKVLAHDLRHYERLGFGGDQLYLHLPPNYLSYWMEVRGEDLFLYLSVIRQKRLERTLNPHE